MIPPSRQDDFDKFVRLADDLVDCDCPDEADELSKKLVEAATSFDEADVTMVICPMLLDDECYSPCGRARLIEALVCTGDSFGNLPRSLVLIGLCSPRDEIRFASVAALSDLNVPDREAMAKLVKAMTHTELSDDVRQAMFAFFENKRSEDDVVRKNGLKMKRPAIFALNAATKSSEALSSVINVKKSWILTDVSSGKQKLMHTGSTKKNP